MAPIYQAPMEGITGAFWRNAVAAQFGGVEKYYAPFLSPTANGRLAPRAMRDLAPAENRLGGAPLVPQIMANDAERFLLTAKTLADMGYQEVNLNLGCPSGTVTAKRKGAGFLLVPGELDRFLEAVYAASPLPVSLKTRLAMRDAEDFVQLLEIFNRYPVAELIVHPRVREEFYAGSPHWEWFDYAVQHSRAPLCANGNLFSPQAVEALRRRYPGVPLMLGRGLVADPALARRAGGGPPATRQELEAFVCALEEGYCQRLGEKTALFPLKELWRYLAHSFAGSAPYLHRLARAKTFGEYRAAAALLMSECPLSGGGFLPPP